MKINIKKIMCPIDFSENSDHSLRYALALAEPRQAEIILVYVVDTAMSVALSGEMIQWIENNYEERLEEFVEKTRQEYWQVSGRLAHGAPFLEIVKLARKEDIDLIVIGTHGRTGLAHVLIGSVAERVVRKAPCPVLTVKNPEHEFIMP